MDRAVANYNNYKDLKHSSKYYHKLKKMLYELKYEKKMRALDEAKVN